MRCAASQHERTAGSTSQLTMPASRDGCPRRSALSPAPEGPDGPPTGTSHPGRALPGSAAPRVIRSPLWPWDAAGLGATLRPPAPGTRLVCARCVNADPARRSIVSPLRLFAWSAKCHEPGAQMPQRLTSWDRGSHPIRKHLRGNRSPSLFLLVECSFNDWQLGSRLI